MRVAVVDLGTNTCRLFLAEVGDAGAVKTDTRLTTVVRLGQGVDRSGRLDTQSPHTFRAIHSNRNGLISHHLSQPNTVRGNRGERVECFDWTNHNLRGECTRSIERGTHGRCASVRWMRLDHSPQRHLLSLPQLRQQHGMQLTRKNHSFR